MSLTINAYRSSKMVEDPDERYNEPDPEDFAYRNHPEKYEQDADEFERLRDLYEAAQEEYEFDRFRIGYGAFFFLRKGLGNLLGFKYVESGEPLLKISLEYPSDETRENQLLLDFFLHSDCDGKLDHEHIVCLDQVMTKLGTAQLKTTKRPEMQEFYDFVHHSASESDVEWEFI